MMIRNRGSYVDTDHNDDDDTDDNGIQKKGSKTPA